MSKPSTLDHPSRASAVMLAAGMTATWLAAGSTGLLGHPLQHALTWLALAVALTAAWPSDFGKPKTWTLLAAAVGLGLFFTASDVPAVNVLGVAVVLAAIAQVNQGLTRRVALIAAFGATALGCFRFACDAIPTVWSAANGFGWLMGRLAGYLAGYPLNVGATFGGVDFLILMATVYVAWLLCTEPPRRNRAIWTAVAIVAGQFVYLIALAQSEWLLALLPEAAAQPISDINHVGLWTWGEALGTLIPWNLPLIALAINLAIVVLMVRGAVWRPVAELTPEELEREKERKRKEETSDSSLLADMLLRFGPAALAVAAAMLGAFAPSKTDLSGKTVVAYEKGYLNWGKPEYDSDRDGFYGLLPMLVERLGGRFVRSDDLAEDDLAQADVLLLIHPDQPWPQDALDRIWNYVRRGGSLLVAAEPAVRQGESESHFNEVLQPMSMQVCFDTAVPRADHWEQSYNVPSHPAALGLDGQRNPFGVGWGSSLQACWPAKPALVGRWGWSQPGSDAATTGVASYGPDKRLGDLVLAAERRFGDGRVFVLADTLPLRNEMLVTSYPFVGRLLGYLAHQTANPQSWWRQLLTLAAIVVLVWLLAARPTAEQLIVAPAVLALSIVWCMAATASSGRVLPDGRSQTPGKPNTVAYIDGAHLESFNGDSSDLMQPHGIAGLARTLMREGYLPLLATDLAPDRLERAGLLVSIAPAREFSPAERETVKKFVRDGGTFVCIVGAEEARPSASLLSQWNIKVPPSPVRPSEERIEPEPLGNFKQLFAQENAQRYVQFYAGWPVKVDAGYSEPLVVWSDGRSNHPIVVSRPDGSGSVVVIGDTHFADNDNLESADQIVPDNIRFWRWLLGRVVRGRKAWEPPAAGEPSASEKDIDDMEYGIER